MGIQCVSYSDLQLGINVIEFVQQIMQAFKEKKIVFWIPIATGSTIRARANRQK